MSIIWLVKKIKDIKASEMCDYKQVAVWHWMFLINVKIMSLMLRNLKLAVDSIKIIKLYIF